MTNMTHKSSLYIPKGLLERIKHFSDIEILINITTRRKLLVRKNTCIGNCYYICTEKPLVTADISLPSATSPNKSSSLQETAALR